MKCLVVVRPRAEICSGNLLAMTPGTSLRYRERMPPVIPEPLLLRCAKVELAIYRWPEPRVGRPALLLAHGTGFCGPVWHNIAEAFASDFTVYAFDRRGHGASSKPADGYHFADFAQDAIGLIDGLQLHGAYAIGHSAGATDLLLAAAQRPTAFHAIFAIEPTMMNPTAAEQRPELQATREERLQGAGRRRATFLSYEQLFEHYRERPAFRNWQPDALHAYLRYGFEQLPDGSVSLRCAPELERAMLAHIFAAMDGTYRGDARGIPFAQLAQVRCPTRISTTEGSQPIFKRMAEEARKALPSASAYQFEGVGHMVAQVRPELAIDALRRFWSELVS